MKKWIMAAGLATIVGVAILAQTGMGIKNVFENGESHHMEEGKAKMADMARMHRMAEMKMKAGRMARMYRNLLNMDREEGTLSYQNGTFYVNTVPVYFGDAWWLNHTIRSDYDGDGEYETVWNELLGLVGSNVTINGRYDDGMIIVSHINGMFLRMPVVTQFVQLNGTLEEINGSYYINGLRIVLPNRMARSDYDGDGLLERMHEELAGLVGSAVTIDGYVFNDIIKPLHINGIAV